jgi:hypothetical protein
MLRLPKLPDMSLDEEIIRGNCSWLRWLNASMAACPAGCVPVFIFSYGNYARTTDPRQPEGWRTLLTRDDSRCVRPARDEEDSFTLDEVTTVLKAQKARAQAQSQSQAAPSLPPPRAQEIFRFSTGPVARHVENCSHDYVFGHGLSLAHHPPTKDTALYHTHCFNGQGGYYPNARNCCLTGSVMYNVVQVDEVTGALIEL